MPNVYVFPGGRVDAEDDRPSGFTEDMPSATGRTSLNARQIAVCARTAVRETFEETGLLLAQTGTPSAGANPRTGAVWAAYSQAGLAPAFAALSLTARAITPATYPIRFDTIFFTANGAMAHGNLAGDGELEDIGWVPVGSAPDLPMAKVTRLILQEALIRQAGPPETRDLATFNV